MKKALLFSLALFSVAAIAQSAPPLPKIAVLGIDAPTQVLFVGNSYCYYNNSLHNKVLGLAKAADAANAGKYQYKSATISGAYLFQHDVGSYLKPGALGYGKPFDVVILQGNSSEQTTKARRETFAKTVKEDDALIRAAGAKTALLMTWAYTQKHPNYDPKMMDMNRDGYTEAGNAVDALVIPAGVAFQEAYRRKPDIKLQQDYDGHHPAPYGSYLAACVVYASLYGKSPIGLDFDDNGSVDTDTAQFLQTVAWDTVRSYFGK